MTDYIGDGDDAGMKIYRRTAAQLAVKAAVGFAYRKAYWFLMRVKLRRQQSSLIINVAPGKTLIIVIVNESVTGTIGMSDDDKNFPF